MPYQRRIYHTLESLQYGFLYFFAGFLAGAMLDRVFPVVNEKKNTLVILIEALVQCLALVLVVYFIRYRVKQIPLFFHTQALEGYVPYGTPEYGGELMIAIMFVGAQFNLIRKVDILSRRFQSMLGREGII